MTAPKIRRPVDAPAPGPDLEPLKRQSIERVVEVIRKSISRNPNIEFRPPRKR